MGHPLFARLYALVGPGLEEYREELLAGLSGRVIEIGAGNGLNFGHYPPAVTEVVAVEPEPYLRRKAAARAAETAVSVRVVPGRAEDLPAPDGGFDAAVASLVLCSVADQARSLRELGRVLRPGGELRFYEHVVARSPRLSRLQYTLDPVWRHLAGSCRLTRDTLGAVEAAGFEVEECRRFRLHGMPHVLGRARR